MWSQNEMSRPTNRSESKFQQFQDVLDLTWQAHSRKIGYELRCYECLDHLPLSIQNTITLWIPTILKLT